MQTAVLLRSVFFGKLLKLDANVLIINAQCICERQSKRLLSHKGNVIHSKKLDETIKGYHNRNPMTFT